MSHKTWIFSKSNLATDWLDEWVIDWVDGHVKEYFTDCLACLLLEWLPSAEWSYVMVSITTVFTYMISGLWMQCIIFEWLRGREMVKEICGSNLLRSEKMRKCFSIQCFQIVTRMGNVSDKCCRENQSTHFMFSNFFPKIVPFIR
jgi:hypothetical protein